MDHTEMMSQHSSSKEETISYGYTWAKEDTFNYKWTIQNFENCLSKNSLRSPESFGRIENNLLWYLKFEIYETNEDYEHQCSHDCAYISLNEMSRNTKYLKLSLFQHDYKTTDVHAKYKLLILNNKGDKENKIEEQTEPKFCKPNSCLVSLFCGKYPEFSKEEKGYLLHGTLTVFCKVTIVDIVKNFCSVKVPDCRLLQDLENVFKELKFCDLTFLVGGREFQAHKIILSARSPVFAAMFDHEFVESKENSITITDVGHEVFEEILRFIYTGRAKNIESMAYKLLIAADKYALERLKVICEDFLIKEISIDNVCDLLVLADKHSVNHLQMQTMEFIKNNFVAVKKTVGWKCIKDYPLLLMAMLEICIEGMSLV